MKTINIESDSEKLNLPAIGIGTSGYGGYFKRLGKTKGDFSSKKSFIDLIGYAYDAGARIIDTAENYAEGASEEIIGSVPQSIKNELFIMSKFSPQHSSRGEITKALDRSLKRLNRDFVDVYQPHWPSENNNIEEMAHELLELVHVGKIKYIGLSNYSLNSYKEMNSFLPNNNIKFIQAEYGPFENSIELDFLPEVKKNNAVLVSYSPLGGGSLLKPQSKNFQKLSEIAQENNATVAQLILGWVIRSGSVIAIPKASTKKKLNENFATLKMTFKKESLTKVSDIFKPEVVNISMDLIDIVPDGDRIIYYNLQEAKENKYNLFPGPEEAAKEIELAGGNISKPIKLRKARDGVRYELVEGRIKFWGWMILFSMTRPIPAIIIQ